MNAHQIRQQLQYGDFDIGTVVGTALNSGLSSVVSSAIINNFKTIEIRTALSPPIVMNVAELLDTTSPPSEFSKFLQPTVILTPRSGTPTIIAPYGVATNGSAAPGFALLVGLIGVGFFLGRMTKKT